MEAKDKEILLKILRHAENIELFCEDCYSAEDFVSSDMTLSATAFELLQIGELAKIKLSDEAKGTIEVIPWDSIYGLRNRIVHGYDDIDHNIMWETVSEDVPFLIKELKSVLNKEKNKENR